MKVEKSLFVVGEIAPPFLYHDKLRVGKVERVSDSYVTLEFDEECPKHKTKFKTFTFNKIVLV